MERGNVMAKSPIEKAIEKQQREAKKMAQVGARRQRAASIVNGQGLKAIILKVKE